MKKIYLFLTFIALLFAAGAQTADLEIVGFADANGNLIPSLVMNPTQDLQPRVILKNNGPDAVASTDSVIFDITYNTDYYAATLVLTGEQLHSVEGGEQVIIDLAQPIWTAEIMDEYYLMSCTLCYEVRISGITTDPNAANNKACIDVTRTTGIGDNDATDVSLFPNPASAVVTLTGAENARVQLFDLSGKLHIDIERASANQQVDISALAAGLYIVRISDGKGVVTQKLNVVR